MFRDLNENQTAIRDGVQAICENFGDDYWLARDADGVFPHDFHGAFPIEFAHSGMLILLQPVVSLCRSVLIDILAESQNPDAQFTIGLNRGNDSDTLQVMREAARWIDSHRSSLLFSWLHETGAYGDPSQDDFTPGQASRSVSPRRSESTHMDVDL